MSVKINPILPKHQSTTNYKPTIKPKVADKTKQTNQAINRLAVRFGGDDEFEKEVKTAKPETFTPKSVIIPLRDGKKMTTHEALSYRLVKATLEQNGIKPSKIEMEEMMALPQNQKIDMHGWLDKKWKFHNLPGIMPSPGNYKDINGKEAFGYKMTLSPKWQAGIINDYKQVRGELAKPENIGKKAVLDMDMKERMQEVIKIAYEKGYIGDEVKQQLGNITPEEAVTAFGLGGLIGLVATTEIGSVALGPVGGVLGIAYMSKKLAEFDPVTEGAAKATTRRDLDKPAQELGKWLGSLAKDGALTVIGAAGGIAATKGMPPLEQALSKRQTQIKQAIKPQPEAVTPEGVRVKVPQTENVKGSNVLESKANGFPNQRIPSSDGSWNGKVGESGWLSTKPKVIAVTNGEPVPFKNGFPIFDKWKVGEIKLPKMKGNHGSDFSKADELFAKKQGWYKPNGKIDGQRVKDMRDTQKLTWHHHEDKTTMQLVPADLNNNVSHTGGAALVKRK
jgi:DNase/tRNase domain of colicin-like bacteriocin